jgi:hypothetical protein
MAVTAAAVTTIVTRRFPTSLMPRTRSYNIRRF